MQGATPGFFHADTQSRYEPHPPASSVTSGLTRTTPAKRITFYKSGDTQFKGVKMAIHKRSFKCFDALLDDLSQKVPLPFGVRTITTPRGIHSIKHLEQLEDGGCYLCSDRRYVKPINMEAVGKRPTVWHHSQPHNARRKPSRPDDAPSGHQHRHRKRIVLVKNTDPSVRRSVLLSRRTSRCLRVFLDEISELMQCQVKKLYTLEGCKIDSIQSLMQCPSVLVCVGREPFKPLLMENLRKLSDERLPGMSTRSRSSVCSEIHEGKKNVNFGLETKKSIIHPRSDSSNRSTRFSLSSEKSYQNGGLCTTPGQSACVSTCPYVKEVSMNDDIEKRVLVNNDGSLSVEMRVRFRLFNDETLQWSTEIKKSSTKLADSGSPNRTAPPYLRAKAECSDPESISPAETEEVYATVLHEEHLEESLCQNRCNHCQEYDIWKNPIENQEGCKSLSSSGSSQKMVSKKTSVDSTHVISRSREEYTKHVVENASCFKQTIEEGDTRVEYCARSHCCNRTEVSGSDSRGSCENGNESNSKNKHCFGDIREPETKLSPLVHYEVTDERAISAVSSSSKALECLKDDQNDEYDDLPPSISRASNWSRSDLDGDAKSKCIHCCDCQTSPTSHLSPRPPSKVSSSAIRSFRSKSYKTPLVAADRLNLKVRTASPVSNVSSKSHTCTPSSSGKHRRAKKGAKSTLSRHSQASLSKSQTKAATDTLDKCEDEIVQENGCIRAMSVKSSLCYYCAQCKEPMSSAETESQKGEKDGLSTTTKTHENLSAPNNYKSVAKISNNSKPSNHIAYDKCSVGKPVCTEIGTKRCVTTKSAESTKSNCIISDREPTATGLSETKSHTSEETKSNVKMCCNIHKTKAAEDACFARVQFDKERSCETSTKCSHMQKKDNNCNLSATECNKRGPSAMSNTSSASLRSHRSSHNLPETAVVSLPKKTDECETKSVSERTNSAISQSTAISKGFVKTTCHGSSGSHLGEAKTQEEDVKDESERVLSRLSGKLDSVNNMKSLCNQLNASVSPLRLPEEHKCDDNEEQSAIDITEDAGCKLDVEERPQTILSEKFTLTDSKTSKIRSSSALSALSLHSKSTGKAKTASIQVEISSKHHNSERASQKTIGACDCLTSSKASECSEMSKKECKMYKHSSKCNCPEEDTSKPNSVVMSDISQRLRSQSQDKLNKHKSSIMNLNTSEIALSKALSAADLLREIVDNASPVSRESKSITSSKNIDMNEQIEHGKSEKCSRNKHRKVINASENHNEEQESLMPSCLPNTSTVDVVNDWLMNNPIDGPVYDMENELIENIETQGEVSGASGNATKVEEDHQELSKKNTEMENYVTCGIQSCDERHQVKSNEFDFEKDCPSSVQVMKVLLGPKLDRCRSLPEVSHVYGRKLSRSAQGLLDCLANLQLIEIDPKTEKHQKYNEVMTILQSLWLQEPSEDEQKKHPKTGQQSGNELNLQSSSGVDVSSGSAGSVKKSMSGKLHKSETAHGEISSITEQSALNKERVLMEDQKTAASFEKTSNISDPTIPYTAERVHGSSEIKDAYDRQENTILHTAEEAEVDTQSVENKHESDQTQQTSSNKSSGNALTENTSSGTPPFIQRAPFAKRVSQDPDPIWVLSLLNKLEKQFMLHYVDAMAEFKVKWDLDDNEMLNTMIGELKEEVHKRIQTSIKRELQKIQSRAGKGPRPPGTALSKESTAQTEQRRRRLRVMRNKSITFSRGEENFTASGQENNDQRSDDEYCPCDACMKRKMESKVVQQAEALSLAPVMVEFDLRKILQMKKDPVKPTERKVKHQSMINRNGTGEEKNLEVLHEEVVEGYENGRICSKEDIKQDDNIETDDKDDEDCETKNKDCNENDGDKVEKKKAEIMQDDEWKNEDVDEVVIVENAVDVEKDKKTESSEDTDEKEAPQQGPKECLQVAPEKGPEQALEDVQEEGPDEGPEEAPEDAPEEATGKTPEEGPGEAAEEAPEKAPEETSEEPKNDNESYSNKNISEKNDEKENPNKKNDNGNQTDSLEKVERDEQEDEDQPTTSRANIKVREDPENKNQKQNSTEQTLTEDTEQDKSVDSSGVDSEMTKTSIESQPGSEENSTNQQTKLHDLQNFMESVESQVESVVVITKQPPYKDSNGLHGRDEQKEHSKGVMEWQISPKIKNKTYKANKLKDGDILMNGK